ncbi:MAG: metal ABC transporter ATP-binding protein [Nitrospirae bacterium]|nr:metal ABC transporter ATP-binding protein [Nitrospirota bacterium]
MESVSRRNREARREAQTRDENMHCIELKDVSFSYDGSTVLENVSLAIAPGDYAGLIGPNGGGKTTLLKIILCLLKPTTGEVWLFGQKASDFGERNRIGYVPQRAVQHENYFPATVEEVVESGRFSQMGLFKFFGSVDRKAVSTAFAITDLENKKKRLIGALSGGERQRVFIARALAAEPDVLILDEPVVGVDAASQERFYSFLKYLNEQLGITIIIVSHDIAVISKEVRSILCLNKNLFTCGYPNHATEKELIDEVYCASVNSLVHRH